MPFKDDLIMAIDIFNFCYYFLKLFVYTCIRAGGGTLFGDSIQDFNAMHLDVVMYFILVEFIHPNIWYSA